MEPRREAASPPEPSPADAANGCAKGCVTLFAVILLCSVGFGVWVWIADPEPSPPAETVRMTGTIRLAANQCSFEQQVRINPRNRTPVLLQMDGGSYRPGLPCNLTIDTEVEEATSYEIDVKGVGKETFPHSLINTRDASGRVVLDFELSFR